MRIATIALLLLLFLSSGLQAQPYLFSHLGVREGLASEAVNSVQQDHQGFIWIGTANGLQRYDGNRFLTFRHTDGDSSSIPQGNIGWLLIDRLNRLWILSEGNHTGYFTVDDFKFHEVPVQIDKRKLPIYFGRLFLDNRGCVILLFGSGMITTYSEDKHEFSSAYNLFQIPAGWLPNWLSQDKYHNYWVGCEQGLVKYNPTTKNLSYEKHNADNDAVINAMQGKHSVMHTCLDKTGMLWMVLWPHDSLLSVVGFDTHTGRFYDWTRQVHNMVKNIYFEITRLTEQSDGSIWLMGLNLFSFFDKKENKWMLLPSNMPGEFSIRYDMANSTTEDREHNIWVCTNKGLFRYNPAAQVFQTVTNRRWSKDSVFTPDISDFLETKNGEILVSTWGSALFPYNQSLQPVKLQYVDESLKLYEGLGWCVHQLKNGDIWRGAQDGFLFISHLSTGKSERLRPPVFENKTIRQITEDKDGNLWFGTQKGALIKWIAAVDSFMRVQQLSSPVQRLYVDSQGNVWAGTRRHGLYQIDSRNGNVLYHYSADAPSGKSLMSLEVTDIIQYNDSLMLIACGGINELNTHTHTIRFIDPKNNSFSNTVTNLIFDKDSTLWISTQNRLFSMDMKKEAATDYNESDGIQTSDFNPGASVLLHDGRILLGRLHDFIAFHPKKVKSIDFTPPRVEITSVLLLNQPLSEDSLHRLGKLELPYNKNNLTIQFSTLAYQNKYAVFYKLDGLDKDWRMAENNEAVYSYLPPGSYTFLLRSRNGNDENGKEITKLSFVIQPPFWQTWWFYGLVILSVVALFYWIDRMRLRRKNQLEAVRTNISDNLHEEVSNALQDINVLSEIARMKADAEPDQSVNYINEIHYKSNHMIVAMDDMLWTIDPANDSMIKIVERAKEFAASVGYTKDIAIDVNADPSMASLKPGMKLRHELWLIYKLVLQLLIEETETDHITVQFSIAKGGLQVAFFAAGKGQRFSKANEQSIWEEIQQRAASLSGIADKQTDDKGTAIIVNMKM